MEELLNKLIQRGWKPFYAECNGVKESNFETIRKYVFDSKPMFCPGGVWKYKSVCIRQIVSKESGLWQFVCENGMVDDGVEYKGYALVDVDGGAIAKYENGCRYLYSNIEPEFYIMESALCNEDKLEQFLLDNIKL